MSDISELKAQFTLTDDTDIVVSIDPPEYARKDMLWLAVGQNPIMLYRWSGIEGTLGGVEINSKTHCAYNNTDTSTTLVINNPLENFSIYSFICAGSSAENNNVLVNNVTFTINNNSSSYIVGDAINEPNLYLSFVADNENFTTLIFNGVTQCYLWCPVKDERFLGITTPLQEQITQLEAVLQNLALQTLYSPQINAVIDCIGDTSVELFQHYLITENSHGLSFLYKEE